MTDGAGFFIGLGIFAGLWISGLAIAKAILLGSALMCPRSNEELNDRGKDMAEGLKKTLT